MIDPYTPEHYHDEPQSPPSISHFIGVLRAYSGVITITLLAAAVAVAIISLAVYLLAPSQRITSQEFRLDFAGASIGEYPNGTRFSTAEIVSTPILIKVYNDNKLEPYLSFSQFMRSVFVLEANAAYQSLIAEYQAALSDPRLTTVDRERIQKEYDLKRASLSKDQYSINLATDGGTKQIPRDLAKKILRDVLTTWANFAANEQHVLSYRVAVLSPELVRETPAEHEDQIVAVQVLRTKVMRVLENIDQISKLPAADLARTTKENLSLTDIRVRLEEIVRFRLEPLMSVATSPNRAASLRFLQAQLEYDQRQLESQKANANAMRLAFAAFTATQFADESVNGVRSVQQRNPAPTTGNASGETVMPQLSDSFLDRLMTLMNNATSTSYRQKLVDDYRKATVSVAPIEQAVAYDQQALREVAAANPTATAAVVAAQIASTRQEVQQLMVKVGEVYEAVSKNLNPATHLYTTTAPPVIRVERSTDLKRLALYAILALLITLLVTIVFCFGHNRMRQEEIGAAHIAPDSGHAS